MGECSPSSSLHALTSNNHREKFLQNKVSEPGKFCFLRRREAFPELQQAGFLMNPSQTESTFAERPLW